MGNVLTYTDRKGQVTTFTYDELNRPTLVTYGDGSTVTPTFDSGNRLTQIHDSVSGTITRTYDDFDQLLSENTPQGTISYTYDGAGRRSTMTVASQPIVSYSYDAADRLTSISQGTETVVLGYDDANRRTTLTLPNGVVATYGYDDANQITSILYTKGATTVGNLAYVYDAAGRRISQLGGFGAELLPEATGGTNAFDPNNRQTLWNGLSLTYDLNGDLTADIGSAPAQTYTFDARHRLVEIAQGGSTIATFAYDVFGRRISKAIAGTTTTFLYDRNNAVQEMEGTTVSGILTGANIDERFARDDVAGRRYFLTDALGSTLALTDAAAAVQATYTYGSYGEATTTGSSNNPYQYTGRENDGTGLYYYRARYYSPALKRFISEDSAGLAGGLNAYSYVEDNPPSFLDPMGLSEQTYPPPNIPGHPYRWSPDPSNSRGGKFCSVCEGDSPPSVSWDPEGHWDFDDGTGFRQRFDRWGNAITAEQAHNPPPGYPRTPINFGRVFGPKCFVAFTVLEIILDEWANQKHKNDPPPWCWDVGYLQPCMI